MSQPTAVTTLGEHWGSAVARRRTLIDLTQVQLAEMCGVTQQAISRIERGAVIPTDRLKLVIARRLGLEPGELFAWPSRDSLVEGAA